MQIDLTASYGACQSSAYCLKDSNILWLQPRSSMRTRPARWSRKALLNLTVSIGLGTFLVMATTTATTDPAEAAEPQPMASTPPASSSAGQLPADPLESIVPAAPLQATNAELQAKIIVSMQMTAPPTAEGGEDDDQIFMNDQDLIDFDDMRVPRWLVDTILRASETTGVDPVYMMALADKESSFIPSNRAATSSAEGLFQFIASTWLEVVQTFGRKHGLAMEAEAIQVVNGQRSVQNEVLREHILGLRRNPYISALMAAEMMKRDKAKIESRLGRSITRSEFYLAHFFGVDSASKFIALVDDKPKKSAPSVFPEAAKSNKALFFAKDGKKTRQLSVAEVYGKLDTMIDKRLDRYEDVSARGDASL